MKRKILSFLLILTLIFSVSPLTGLDFNNIFTTAFAQTSGLIYGDFEYTYYNSYNSDRIEITDYLGSDTEITVPAEIDGIHVKSIGSDCFSCLWGRENTENKNKITKIIVSEGIEEIKSSAFQYCNSLETVIIPQSIKSLSCNLFYSCDNLKELTLPGKDITFQSTFNGSYIETLNLNEGMTEISADFLDGTIIKSITFPSTIETVSNAAFINTVVETVIFDGPLSGGFYPGVDDNFGFMKSQYFPSYINKVCFRYMPCDMPYNDKYDINYDKASGYWVYTPATDYSSNEVYNDAAFDYILNENGEAVLTKYTGYNSYVVIPETVGFAGINYGVVTEIGSDVFADTYAQKVILHDNIKKIGKYAFRNSDVSVVEIPDSVTEIGDGAFSFCESLESLVLPESVTKIGINAFKGCINLKNINWPSKVNYVPAEAFARCTSFNDFGIFENVEIISSGAFYGCESLVVDSFGDNLKEIGDFAFTASVRVANSGKHSTINAEILPESLEYIGNRAFAYNESLNKIIIPESIKLIGEGAFAYSSLKEVELPDNLKEISRGAFALTSLKSIDLPPTLEKIGEVAFLDCLSLEEINLPDTVTYIGDGAFSGCESVTELKIPSKLETINKRTFASMTSLKEIYIPSTVKTIGESAFGFCHDVTKITIASGVESIGNYAFIDNNIKEITIPESVKELGYGIINDTQTAVVYYNAVELDRNLYRSSSNDYPIFSTPTLKKIVFGKNVKLVPAYCSYDCDSLEQIVFSGSIREIDLAAFAYCDSIKYIAMPGGVQKIDNAAFYECLNLETAVIPETVTDIHEYAFSDCNENFTIVCTKDSYAYDYATEYNIKVRVTDSQTNTPAQNTQHDLKKETNDYFASFLNSLMNKIKDFFAQFKIISR